jgi:hypothetical protein
MTRQVTLELPDELYEQAQSWAALSQQELPGALTDVLSLALTPLPTLYPPQTAVSGMDDAELLALSNVQMESEQGRQLDELLSQQSSGTITREGQRTLIALMQIYHQFWLRQSFALAEAVRRGLLPPLLS